MLLKHRFIFLSVPLLILPVCVAACNQPLTHDDDFLSGQPAPSITSKDLSVAESMSQPSEKEQVDTHKHNCNRDSAEEWIEHIDKTLNSLDIKHS